MKILISPIALDEARQAALGGADIIDIKNVNEGSLGAHNPCTIKDLIAGLQAEFPSRSFSTSCTLGDLPYKPGTAALAAFGAAHCGVSYIKAGLHGFNAYEQALDMVQAISNAIRQAGNNITFVAAGYADYQKINSVSPSDLVKAASKGGCSFVMLDTAIKDGSTLFDVLSEEEIRDFVTLARNNSLKVALAGSLRHEHAPRLKSLAPDIIGVRGAVCEGNNRQARIERPRVEEFVALFRGDTGLHT